MRDLGNDSLDVEFALDLFELADRYLVDALKQLCEDAILKTVSVSNGTLNQGFHENWMHFRFQ